MEPRPLPLIEPFPEEMHSRWADMLRQWRTSEAGDLSDSSSEDVATFMSAEADANSVIVEGTPVTTEELPASRTSQAGRGELERIEVELPRETIEQMQALATLGRRSVAEEWNAAASFWVFARRTVSEGGTMLVRNRSGKVGPVDLQIGET